METELYPRLSIRLSRTLKLSVAEIAFQRRISKGRVVRDALTQYLLDTGITDDII